MLVETSTAGISWLDRLVVKLVVVVLSLSSTTLISITYIHLRRLKQGVYDCQSV